jgi:aminoglycoside phosphotransferase (APT) family kinase protein
LASGRDADIFEYGDGLVLRRSRRADASVEHEARVMSYVHSQGFPVPEVHEVLEDGKAIVMDRLEGPNMLDAVARRPHHLRRIASTLADLHDQLHALPVPDWLPRPAGDGGSLLHLDLHPLNVIMTPRGPVVIDWTNASAGDALTDVGFTYVLLTCPRVPLARPLAMLLEPFRKVMAAAFVKRYRGADLWAHTAAAAERKMLDRNLDAVEVERCRRLAARLRRRD